jgi:hypothetical protein
VIFSRALLRQPRFGVAAGLAGPRRQARHRVSASFRSNAITTARNRAPTFITGISPLFAAAYEPLRPKPK